MREKIKTILKSYLVKASYFGQWIIYEEYLEDITIELEKLFIQNKEES